MWEVLIRGNSGQQHSVDFGKPNSNPSCTCQHWVNTNFPCKHFFLVFRFRKDWTWDSLPQCYLDSPYLCADTSALSHSLVNPPNLSPAVHGDDDNGNEFEHGSDDNITELRPRVSE